jgi:hypothetical protein
MQRATDTVRDVKKKDATDTVCDAKRKVQPTRCAMQRATDTAAAALAFAARCLTQHCM